MDGWLDGWLDEDEIGGGMQGSEWKGESKVEGGSGEGLVNVNSLLMNLFSHEGGDSPQL
ncbi:hypothetical protein [Paenibacillus koleovorans]|uniref:hypothetical protein n=1 Tax=Paenibacillus koleovorans TaxID=121608 RepID=UPI0013E3CB59|nr:hypothetical protein [Paenibacillus koleovorans]